MLKICRNQEWERWREQTNKWLAFGLKKFQPHKRMVLFVSVHSGGEKGRKVKARKQFGAIEVAEATPSQCLAYNSR